MTNERRNGGANDAPFLVQFFDPAIAAKDFQGRTLKDILAYDDDDLESGHDYIQVIFPLPEGSMFNWKSPVIDEKTFEAFHAREDLRNSLQDAFKRIGSFYGFDVNYKGPNRVEIKRSADHVSKFKNWVVRMDHNHLRISRIIRSLRVLGLEAHAAAYFEALQKVNQDFPNRIGARSMMYWQRAAKRPLYLAPDQDDDEAVEGPRFLIDFEMNKSKV